MTQGTTPEQRVLTATLDSLQMTCAVAKITSPALLVVGEVVALHRKRDWFNDGSAADLPQSA